jgi:hypothetical protein
MIKFFVQVSLALSLLSFEVKGSKKELKEVKRR